MARRREMNRTGSVRGAAPGQVPVPKLTSSNSRLGRTRRRKPAGKVTITIGILSILLCLGLGIYGFVSTTEELPYRAGWAGTPGTVSSVDCWTEGSGRGEHTVCAGVFQADSHTLPTPVSVEGDSTYTVGHDYPARLHADGSTVSVVGGKPVAYILGGMLAILGFLVFLGGMLAIAIVGFIIRRRRGSKWQPGKRVTLTPMIIGAILVGLGIIGGIVGAILNV